MMMMNDDIHEYNEIFYKVLLTYNLEFRVIRQLAILAGFEAKSTINSKIQKNGNYKCTGVGNLYRNL